MYTEEQVIDGLLCYIKKEVIPVLPTSAKVLAGAALLHNAGRMSELLRSDALRTIGLISDGGIDVDVWAQDLSRSMDEFCSGRAEVRLPMLSPIIFTTQDVDTLRRYIKGEIR